MITFNPLVARELDRKRYNLSRSKPKLTISSEGLFTDGPSGTSTPEQS
jgi:hypothetical protein